jgi:hypothetical protein
MLRSTAAGKFATGRFGDRVKRSTIHQELLLRHRRDIEQTLPQIGDR